MFSSRRTLLAFALLSCFILYASGIEDEKLATVKVLVCHRRAREVLSCLADWRLDAAT
jgi:hypothetical protein